MATARAEAGDQEAVEEASADRAGLLNIGEVRLRFRSLCTISALKHETNRNRRP